MGLPLTGVAALLWTPSELRQATHYGGQFAGESIGDAAWLPVQHEGETSRKGLFPKSQASKGKGSG